MNLKKRTMDEMITHFNDVVSEMNIPRKDKMTLLGMITAIGYEAQNAADVVPVVRGKWEEWWPGDCALIMTGEEMLWMCSKCTAKFSDRSAYCPNCGARMDGDGDV